MSHMKMEATEYHYSTEIMFICCCSEIQYDEFKIYGRINVNGSFNFRRRDFSSDFF